MQIVATEARRKKPLVDEGWTALWAIDVRGVVLWLHEARSGLPNVQ